MTKANSTKKALLSSAFALLICVAMLIGTTFAWFTDTASTAVNRIESGTLTVDIVKDDGETSLKGESMSFVNAEGSADILWEPGVTFKTPAFMIKNSGKLALKYKLTLNGITGDSMLLDVITFSVVKEDGSVVALDTFEGHLLPEALSDALYIQGHMDETANNDYQGKTLEGLGITVSAAQDTVEKDSKDDQYDKNADYPEVEPVTTAEDIKAALTSEETNGKTIKLYSDINIDAEALNVAGKDVAIDLNGKDLTVNKGMKVKNATVVIKDGSETGEGQITVDNSALYGVLRAENSDVTIESGKFVSTYANGSSGYARVISVSDSNLTINGG